MSPWPGIDFVFLLLLVGGFSGSELLALFCLKLSPSWCVVAIGSVFDVAFCLYYLLFLLLWLLSGICCVNGDCVFYFVALFIVVVDVVVLVLLAVVLVTCCCESGDNVFGFGVICVVVDHVGCVVVVVIVVLHAIVTAVID